MPDTTLKRQTSEPPNVAIIMATRLEAEPFLDVFRLVQRETTPCPLYGDGQILLAVSGIGKTNAAIATTYCCSVFHPSWVLNPGAAGATGANCGRGAIFHVTRVFEPDRPHFRSHKPYEHVPHRLVGFDEATMATQDRPVIDQEGRKQISGYASLADMEGAAVVQTARRFGTPCVLFKFVSDTPDDLDTHGIIDYIQDRGKAFSRFIAERVIPLLSRENLP
jgi:adenosylhomocysteine nucleosidase